MYGPEQSKKTLLDRIQLFRQQNNLPELEYLDDTVENYWCGLPENIGRCEPKTLPLGILGTLKGAIVVLKNYMYKSFAPQEVAEKRAKQCASCKYNTNTNEQRGWVELVALNSIGSKRTAQFDRLGKCAVCSCVLNMKVFYDGKIEKPTPDQMEKYESVQCWQLNIIEK